MQLLGWVAFICSGIIAFSMELQEFVWKPDVATISVSTILAVVGISLFILSRKKAWSFVLIYSAVLIFIFGVEQNVVNTSGWIVLLVLSLAILGAYMILRGRRYATPSGAKVLSEDSRKPVVFLRSFGIEERSSKFGAFIHTAFADSRLADDIPSFEPVEQFLLAQFFSKIGPYVAVGKPGEIVPHSGAAKIYLAGETWKAEVLKLLDRSRLVVLRSGSTPGLQWEFVQVVKSLPPARVLLILSGRKKDYQVFRSWANSLFPSGLPEEYPGSRLLVFSDTWSCEALEYRSKILDTLQPFLKRNDIEVKKFRPGHFLKRVN